MKKVFISLLLCFCFAFFLVSCSGESVPAGMQSADCDGLPYHTFLPDQWEIRRTGDHLEACVSSSTPVAITVRHLTAEEENVNDYWQNTEEQLKTIYADFKIEEKLTEYTFCGETGAVVSYSGKLETLSYRFLQAMILKDGTLYLVTYSAQTNIKTGTDLYATYLDDAYRVIDNMEFAEAKNESAADSEREENDKGLALIGDAQTKGWKVRFFAPKTWVDESYGTFAFARDPETNASLSLCTEETDAKGFEDYWQDCVRELKAVYPASEFLYEDASNEEGATVGDTEKLVFEETKTADGLRMATLEYVLVTANARYQCVKIAVVGGYKLYVLTFMFPEGSFDSDAQKTIVRDVFDSFEIQ